METEHTEAAPAAAAPKRAPKLPDGYVLTRIMKRGHNRISTGELNPLTPDNMFPKHQLGELVAMPKATAEKYEEVDGWVEILP